MLGKYFPLQVNLTGLQAQLCNPVFFGLFHWFFKLF